MNMLPEVAVVCEWSWSSQSHTCRLFSVALFNHVSSTAAPSPKTLCLPFESIHLTCLIYGKVCWCCQYLPCASKELLRIGVRMAPETSICVRGVGEIQEVYLSSPTQQHAMNCSSLLPPAGSCPRALHSLLVLEPCLEPAHYCRDQRCPRVEVRSYKHLVTLMMK